MEKQTIRAEICGMLEDKFCVSSEELENGNSQLNADFGLDSLDVVELITMCEEKYGIRIPDRVAEGVVDMTVDEVVDLVSSKVNEREQV